MFPASDQPRVRLVPLDRAWRLWPLAGVRSAGMPFGLLTPLAVPDLLTRPAGPERDAAVHAATTEALRGLFGDQRLRMALTWQNPDVMARWVAGYLAMDTAPRPNSKTISGETFLARHAQRYCSKNDTIGFFGPVSFARLDAPQTTVRGTPAIRRSRVYVETWAARLVAMRWNGDPALRPHLPVRLNPACSVVDRTVRRPRHPPMPLDRIGWEVVRKLADAVRTVGELVAQVGPNADQALDDLSAQHVVQIGFRVPLDTSATCRLREQVVHISDTAVRRQLCATLDDLDRVRDAVAVAASPEELLAALRDYDERLAEAAGRPVSPGPDRAPGGRTPLYLDCRSDLDVTVGPDLQAGLSGPLTVLLDSARWLIGQIGEAVHDTLLARCRRLRRRRPEVDLADLLFFSSDVLTPGAALLTEVLDDFQQRWAEIIRSGADDVTIPIEDARRLADALFAPGGRLWAAARTHSPDLMLRRVDGRPPRWVLGELHVGLNTLQSEPWHLEADDPDEMIELMARYTPPGRVVPIYPSDAPRVSGRSYPPPKLDPPGRYRYFSYASDDGHPSGVRGTPITDLLVSEQDGDLIASSKRDGWGAPILEFFGEFLCALAGNLFQIRPQAHYLPRVEIGELTVCRRSWSATSAELAPVPTRATDPTHERIRRWAASRGITQHVFARSVPSGQPLGAGAKPFYVDFTAPVLIDCLAREIRRRGESVDWVFTEMLPAPDELWLSTPDGARYTSEFRLVAVEPGEPPPASWPIG